MTSPIAISLKNISKVFKQYRQPADRLKEIFLPGKSSAKEFWALRNVSFDISKGQTWGIVGRNGAGKSTLLQIIAGTLQPTVGTVQVNGRVSALLELGSGFNPEFTGRQNVHLNSRILGLSQEETAARFDGVAKFADIGDFIDQPVKTYSSGMRARLAFAVASSVDPDILIVDEVLSVGDAAFQRKCFSRMEAIREQGCTILFVSHSAASVVQLCDYGVLMDSGEKLLIADAKTITTQYQRFVYASPEKSKAIRQEIKAATSHRRLEKSTSNLPKESPVSRSGQNIDGGLGEYFNPGLVSKSVVSYSSSSAKIKNPRILNLAGQKVNVLLPGKLYQYCYTVTIIEAVKRVRCGMLLKTIRGLELGGITTHHRGNGLDFLESGTELSVRFEFCARLNAGTYFLNAGVLGFQNDQEVYLDRLIDAVIFRIAPAKDRLTTGYVDFSDGIVSEIMPQPTTRTQR